VPFAAGQVIFRQGDAGDAFYLVGRGSVRVLKDGAPVAELGAGGFFGEIALLFDVKRTATVEGIAAGDLYRMSRADFERMIEGNRLIGDLIRVTAQRRLAKEDAAPAH
jgi:CRP-like cAMP-binding protein